MDDKKIFKGPEINGSLFPLEKVYIEPTSYCNLECKMCSRSAWFNENIGEMQDELYNNLIDEIKVLNSVNTIFFGGIAEPFAHENILPMLKRAKETGKRVELITNGLLLNEEIISELINIGIDIIWVSVDGCDMESYNNIRVGGNFEKLENNLKLIKKHRMYFNKNTKLGLTFVAMKSNIIYLPKLISLARAVSAVELKISNVIPFSPEMEKETLYYNTLNMQWFSDLSQAKDKEYFTEINIPIMDYTNKEVSSVMGEVMSSSKVIKLGESYITHKSRHCKFINDNSLFVRWDGEVCPCMSLLHNNITYINNKRREITHCSFGNISERTLMEIWNSKIYSEFREKVDKFDFSHCLKCSICDFAEKNQEDCYGNSFPTCGACLWSEGLVQCP